MPPLLPPEDHEEQITKLDAAARQLRTAIRLFLEDGDAVAIHTLASAAQEVLRGLLKPRGGGSFYKDSDWVRPEQAGEFRHIMNEAQNFFKHADKDPDGTLRFRPAFPAFVLFDCVHMYHAYAGHHLREGIAFAVWFFSSYPDVLRPGPLRETLE